jgi:hypothetical protein
MKIKHILSLLALAVCLGLAACKTHVPTTIEIGANQDHDITGTVTVSPSTNLDIGITGTGNPDTGDYTVGIVVVFKERPESSVRDYILSAGYQPLSATEFILLSTTLTDLQREAMMHAQANGAKVRGFKKSEQIRAWKISRLKK